MFFPRAYHEKIQTPFQSAVARVVPHSIVVPLEKHVVFPRGGEEVNQMAKWQS